MPIIGTIIEIALCGFLMGVLVHDIRALYREMRY